MTSKRQSKTIIPKREIKYKLPILRGVKAKHPYYTIQDRLDKALYKLRSVPQHDWNANRMFKSAARYADSAAFRLCYCPFTPATEEVVTLARDASIYLYIFSRSNGSSELLRKIRNETMQMLAFARQMISDVIAADQQANSAKQEESR